MSRKADYEERLTVLVHTVDNEGLAYALDNYVSAGEWDDDTELADAILDAQSGIRRFEKALEARQAEFGIEEM